jgi:hypothetical protein
MQWPIGWMAGKGLIPILQSHGEKLIGCELGVCYGWNLVWTLQNIPDIRMYAIDPYTPYDDGPGGYFDQDKQNIIKNTMLENIDPYKDRVKFMMSRSQDVVFHFPDGYLDYIFIDGDHSYEAAKRDIVNYYPKVKSGGIFAGHDYSMPGVKKALDEFLDEQGLTIDIIQFCDTDAWYWIKK